MKWHFTFLFFVLFRIGYSQEKAVISGRMIDAETKEPIPYVTVILSTETDKQSLTGALSDEVGRFSIMDIEKGNYILSFSFVGYQTPDIPVLIGKNNIFDLGRIEMELITEQLEEVVIEAKREVVSSGLEKKTYSMEENFAQSTGSVLDALKILPGVLVDQEGKVILRGSDRVAIFIDDKQSSLTGFGNQKGLDNIPVANIDRIEIINNPSAKYDAAGMAGIINIVYKKEKENGLNGEVGLTLGLGQITKRKNDLPTSLGSYSLNSKIIPSLNLNYRTRKVNLFLTSEILHQKRLPNNEFTTRTYDDGTTIISQVPENRTQTQYIINGGMDWFINERNTLTFSMIYDYESHIDTAQVPFINQTNMERYRYWAWSESEITGFMNFRVDHKYKFTEPGHELNISVQYTKGWEDETYFLNDSSDIRNSRDTTHIIATEHTLPFLIDYIKPLKNGRIEAGTKIQLRRIPVTYEIGPGEESVIYPGLGNWSEWGENIFAGYLNYLFEKVKYDIEAGLRIEHTDVFYNISPENIYYDENDAYNYFRLYPNVRFSYKLNDNHNLSAFYNRRVDRPGEPELRIFPKYDDPELLKVGNPYLRPQFTQTTELAYMYNWDKGSIFLSGFYRWIEDPFVRVYSMDTSNVNYDIINKIYHNVGSGTNSGLEILYTQDIGNFWKFSGSVNWFKNVINAYEGMLLFPYQRTFKIGKTSTNTWDLKLNNQFVLSNKIQIQLTLVHYAPRNIPQGKQLARTSIDLGIKKPVFQEKGELIFSFTDMLNTFGIRQEIAGEGFDALYENYYETQVIRLGLKYKF